MPDLLHRFLPAGVPGAAGVAGVPTDRIADEAAELAPLFAQLAATEARCDEIARQAHVDAVSINEHAADQIRGIAARAQQRAESERADVLARSQAAQHERAEAELAAATAQAGQLRLRAGQRIPNYVRQVSAAITDLISGRPADAA